MSVQQCIEYIQTSPTVTGITHCWISSVIFSNYSITARQQQQLQMILFCLVSFIVYLSGWDHPQLIHLWSLCRDAIISDRIQLSKAAVLTTTNGFDVYEGH